MHDDEFDAIVAEAGPEDRAFEAALRPRTDELIGRGGARARAAVADARGGGRPRTHAAQDDVLLSGPPGLGKTTIAMIIAHQLSAPLRITSGPAAIEHARSPACWIAGPLVIRSGAESWWAMIIAIVVLPSPGGPDSSTWSGVRPRATAASSIN